MESLIHTIIKYSISAFLTIIPWICTLTYAVTHAELQVELSNSLTLNEMQKYCIEINTNPAVIRGSQQELSEISKYCDQLKEEAHRRLIELCAGPFAAYCSL